MTKVLRKIEITTELETPCVLRRSLWRLQFKKYGCLLVGLVESSLLILKAPCCSKGRGEGTVVPTLTSLSFLGLSSPLGWT